MAKDDSNDSLQNQVDDLEKRLKKAEDRLKRLEKSSSSNPKMKKRKNPKGKADPKESDTTDHNYLKKTIGEAKKRYEREHNM